MGLLNIFASGTRESKPVEPAKPPVVIPKINYQKFDEGEYPMMSLTCSNKTCYSFIHIPVDDLNFLVYVVITRNLETFNEEYLELSKKFDPAGMYDLRAQILRNRQSGIPKPVSVAVEQMLRKKNSNENLKEYQ